MTVAALAGRALAAEPPVLPDADQARDWLERELAQPIYHERPSLLQRAWEWVQDLFDGVGSLPLGGTGTLVVVVVAVALVCLVAFWVAGPVRRSRRVRTAGSVLADDDRRTAAELRAAADEAARRGDWSAAVADRFRAVVRSLEERALLDEQPGRTAHEAVDAGGRRLPEVSPDLQRAAGLFDEVVYGSRTARADDDAALRALDARVSATRPAPLAGVGAPGGAP